MTSNDALLELDGIGFVDGSRKVLDDVSLQVRAGESVGVAFAQAHSGKTSLLYIAAGLRQPSAGTVRFLGRPVEVDRAGSELSELGMVFRDDGGLFPNLTLLDNVALPLRFHDVSEDEADQRAQAALDEVGLASRADRFPWELTRERMRLAALARALVYRPRLILIDDFFAGPDELSFAVGLRAIQRAQREHGTAFLLVVEAEQATAIDRLVLIDHGHVVEDGG